MAQPSPLLALPTELLDRIASYLDWDRAASLIPRRPDIHTLTLTCQHLRATTLPLLFRNVTLTLRWQDRISRSIPPLSAEAKIRNLIDHTNHAIRQHRIPKLRRRKQDTSSRELTWQMHGEDRPPIGATAATNSYAGRFEPYHGSGPILRKAQRTKLQVDALATLMLCLPPTLNELVFEAGLQDLEEQPWYHFATFLIDGAMQIFGHRLESLTMATSGGSRRGRILASRPAATPPDPVVTSPDPVTDLTALHRLVLASTSVTPETFSAPQLNLLHLDTSERLTRWNSPNLHPTLTHLEIRNANLTDADFALLVSFTAPFRRLQQIAFHHLTYTTRGLPSRIYPHLISGQQHLGEGVLLAFAISLRRALPATTKILFTNISHTTRGPSKPFPPSALAWLMREAVPAGQADVDFQREERLQEDFESFQGLWEAEDGEVGIAAREHRLRVDLVDAAMCSRWRQFENVRKDKGEWETL
ncbi:hypothetical protein B0A55_12570 [Friedmanniomyces simplex]|uniref:F-box domain-containing protein n=1 Tax=Friedmanniomyces simplex TaxID=329884 RepID=A0A4U0WLW2_9PEZI|nr:hypothetical protein B0A55_12570 [Friedmanniomyces simplex]